MSLWIKWVLGVLLVGGVAAVGYKPAADYYREMRRIHWETMEVICGDAVKSITATGTVEPVQTVSIGAFVSGPIIELNVDFNDQVSKGQVLARVDPRLFRSNVARDQAALSKAKAEVARVRADLQEAQNAKQRGERLRETNSTILSADEMDALVYEVEGLEAQLLVAEASVLQAEANLENSMANLEYTEIRSPVDGVVIDRKIDEGQTLAAQFQTPELFLVAPDLQKEMHVYASVAEKDIGIVQQAQQEERRVTFTVDAYPDELFEGEIEEIRVKSTEVQGVVTYPVVIAAPNPERKLLPGMTATISFEIETQSDVLKIPNAALRFFPEEESQVRPADRQLLDASRWNTALSGNDLQSLSAAEKVDAQSLKNKRHVWVEGGEQLRAVEIVTGISESRYTVLEDGDLQAGDELVVARKRK